MSNRINIQKTTPGAYKAFFQLSNYVHSTGLNQIHFDLINIRASQINGCAFCLDMHTQEALAHGENQQRIFTLDAWDETNFFDEKERAILKLTEEVTRISNRVSDATYKQAAELFGDEYLSHIIVAIIAINAWNRMAITTQMQPVLKAAATV
ncbi:carboxymuconolactone decarboxylase family protein [Mucilaginibacter limnophilus]|uniref:Carboxymuconolactone decarboxylase family protein n=1 Tax=Mucilaginibacter limnophilus TaxID=1932778 RepID=A0A437MZL7_9SPHI|nr:carboxymuconolactone decarboxylase family protein [Mucilaginibacter limnophilus]RVU03064.1 carboxymuconolactone decarboxylase family protein [Mucilaginibacter limnophilus]